MIQARRRVVSFGQLPTVLQAALRRYLELELLQDDGVMPDITSIDGVEISFGTRVTVASTPKRRGEELGSSGHLWVVPSEVDAGPPPAQGVVPNIDPFRGYEGAPNGEGAHPHDDATGHIETPAEGVTRTHEDFGPRLEKKHITDLPSWGKVGC